MCKCVVDLNIVIVMQCNGECTHIPNNNFLSSDHPTAAAAAAVLISYALSITHFLANTFADAKQYFLQRPATLQQQQHINRAKMYVCFIY